MLDTYAERWALVTGASSGIGAAFARMLAGRGMHLVLVARREDRLNELAEELDTRHGTRCEIIVADLSEPGAAARVFETVCERNIEVDLLVNNAGFGFVGTVEDTRIDRMLQMIQLNIAALTDLTYRCLPGMIERKHGGVINVSSLAAFQPVAYMPTYSAGKAYVLHFSEALWAECREHGVTVMALCPGTTETEFFDVAGVTSWLKKHKAHSTDYVVRKALKSFEKGKQCCVPGFTNKLILLSVRLARRKMVVRQSMRFFRPRKPEDESK